MELRVKGAGHWAEGYKDLGQPVRVLNHHQYRTKSVCDHTSPFITLHMVLLLFLANAVGSLLGSAGTKPKKNLVYDEKYATMEYIPQPSSRMGGGGFGSYYETQGSGQSHTSIGSGL